MALHTTTWQPDTCRCEWQYEWDDAVSESERVHTPTLVKPCDLHALQSTLSDRWTAVLEHNRRKQKVLDRAVAAGLQYEDIAWSYEGDVLTVNLPTLTNPQRNAIQSWCNTNIGANKVIITS